MMGILRRRQCVNTVLKVDMLQILGNIETYKGRVVEEFDIGSSSSTIRY